jgi:putative ABC transport system permease protein
MALGARPADVLWMVTGHGLGLAAAGVVCGVAGSLAVGRILASRLFGVTASDPATLSAVTLLLLLVAAAACAIPAFRATRIDPAIALRSE